MDHLQQVRFCRFWIFLLGNLVLVLTGCIWSNPQKNQEIVTEDRDSIYMDIAEKDICIDEKDTVAYGEAEPEFVNYTIVEENFRYKGTTRKISFRMDTNRIKMRIDIDLPDSVSIPKAVVSEFDTLTEQERDWIHLYAKLTDSKKRQIAQIYEETLNVFDAADLSPVSNFTPADFKDVKANTKLRLTMDIKVYASTFNTKETEYRIYDAKIAFDFTVYPICYSTLYFNLAELNMEQTDALLGPDNDFGDPSPETGVRFYCNDDFIQKVIGKKNSYRCYKNMVGSFYHNSSKDNIYIEVFDKDYFVNNDDWISDTIIPLKALIGKDYKVLKFSRVDKMEVFCTTSGKVN
ncbi:MAG: hypothetical protein JXB49_08185 [Bacteroidales bacterium]|nr:hypothetical protein [Bacteroidales bacterium]